MKLIEKGDYIVIIITILLSLFGIYFLNSDKDLSKSKTIEIFSEGKLFKKYMVSDSTYSSSIEVKNKYGYNKVYIHDMGVEILDANCTDKVCIKSGFISAKGQIIACLPHKIYVKIDGNQEKVDHISY